VFLRKSAGPGEGFVRPPKEKCSFEPEVSMMRRHLLALLAVASLTVPAGSPPADAGEVLDRIVANKQIRFGFRTDAPPFASIVDGQPAGFSVELCTLLAGAISLTSHIEGMIATFSDIDTAERFTAIKEGKIDVLCGATTATLKRRETVSFTIPTFMTGIGAAIAPNAPDGLRKVLVQENPEALSVTELRDALIGKRLGVRAETTAENWLRTGPLKDIERAAIVPIGEHSEGLAKVASGGVDVYFADAAIMRGYLSKPGNADKFLLSDKTFTTEPYALALPRGDEDLRLVMDRALSYLYRTRAINQLFEKYFGEMNTEATVFYRVVALPE
jgi:polar amino acid transport system substrate-binding protein